MVTSLQKARTGRVPYNLLNLLNLLNTRTYHQEALFGDIPAEGEDRKVRLLR